MRRAIYNSGIPQHLLKTVNCAAYPAHGRITRILFRAFIFAGILSVATLALAQDWNAPEEQLARKIAAATGPGAVALTIENRSSLGKRDQDIVENGLRIALNAFGVRMVNAEQAAATIRISLSENLSSYVWVAEIHQSAGESAVVMVSAPSAEGATASRDSVPLSLHKVMLWSQQDRILDVAVLEENVAPTMIAVLDAENVSLYRMQNGRSQLEQKLKIDHARPWPRDLRGRVIPGRDHLLDVFLPGVFCRSASAMPLTLNCRESDDPWPLATGSLATGPQVTGAFFAPTRNYFTGVLTPGVGKFASVPKFYSAAVLPRDKYALWLFAATDGQVHLIDGVSDQVAQLKWGSDVTSVKTSCGAGWQVLATAAGNEEDSVRGYELPDRAPAAVSMSIELPGPVTALWSEARGDTAIVVARNRETGNYEAFRLALSCN